MIAERQIETVVAPRPAIPVWHRVTYLLAAVPFSVFALFGFEYPDAFIYVAPAVLCLMQAFKPTRPVWWTIFLLYAVGAVAYAGLLLADLFALLQGRTPRALVDTGDSVAFICLEVVLVTLLVAIIRAGGSTRPGRSPK